MKKTIDRAYKEVQGLFGTRKVVTTQKERSELKKRYFFRDDIILIESVPPAKEEYKRNWIDDIEDFDAFMS